MKNKIVFATGNKGKVKEIQEILKDLNYEVLTMKEAGIEIEIEENGKTYEENALIKARSVAQHTDAIVMADDSGLEVDAMDRAPGVFSARFMGEDTSYRIKNAEIIRRLEGKEGAERSARFVCAIAAVFPDKSEVTTRATIEGQIGFKEQGENGFGYDPIFYVPEFGKTTAQLSPEEKNQVSHRGKALRLMKEELVRYESNHCK